MSTSLVDVAYVFQKMRLTRGWSPEELAQKARLPLETIIAYESHPETLTSRTAVRIIDGMPFGPIDESLFDAPVPPFPRTPPRWLEREMDARVLEWEAALRIDQGRFREAVDGLDHALRVGPCPEQRGRLLLSKAAALGEMRWDERALDVLGQAESCFDAEGEPGLWLRLRSEQMYFLCQLNRYTEADALQPEVTHLSERIGRNEERLQAHHLAGRIAAGLGRTEEALRILGEVRDSFQARRQLFEATGVGLEIVSLLISQGNLAEVAELSRQFELVAQEKRLPDATRSTLRLFCKAVQRENFDAGTARRFANDYWKTSSRLTRPYGLPVDPLAASGGVGALTQWLKGSAD